MVGSQMGWTLAAFGLWDWAVMGGYFVVVALSGWWFSRRRMDNTEEYFLGGHRIPVWAAAVSLMATSLSAATFIGGPQQAYTGDLTYLSSNLGNLIAALIVGFFFIPAFYRQRVGTVYQLLGRRYGDSAKLWASWMFMIGRVFASGARLYIAALAVALILFGDLAATNVCLAIGVMVVIGVMYTVFGGVSAVIWTDVIQAFILVGAVIVALVLLWNWIPADAGQVFSALQEGDGSSKLALLKLGWGDFEAKYTFLTAVGGFVLLNIGAYGTDQDMTQRVLTCRSSARGTASTIAGILISIPVTLLFMAVGLLLWVFYRRPDLMGPMAPPPPGDDSREIFLNFILDHVPSGVSGLMMAGLFAAGISSTNSALNAMSSAYVNDYYRPGNPDHPESHYVKIGRRWVVIWGIVLGAFAVISVYWQRADESNTLIDYAISVMTFAYSGLVGVFGAALMTRRGSGTSAVAALWTGFFCVLIMVLEPWRWVGIEYELTLAFPWRMFLATGLAFGVCCLGKTASEEDAEPPTLSTGTGDA